MTNELASMVRKRVIGGSLAGDRARQAIDDLAGLPLTRLSHRALLRRIWELHPNIVCHDAAYVASAEILQAPLVTADARLARAPGHQCAFEMEA
jgi:predicted nucleic acid-binding protein